jgi:Amt family ammonium transporter
LIGAAAALAAALGIRHHGAGSEPDSGLATPMPAAHLPLLGWLGALLMLVGWMATAGLAHLPAAGGISATVVTVNLVLAAAAAACAASLYAWFAGGRLDVLMAGRGMAAGLVATAAGAAFMPAWSALAAGALSGLVLPPLLFMSERRLHLAGAGAPLAILGVPAGLGLLWPGLFADGRFGVGWNRVGLDSYLGVPGQGVSGVWVASGMAADWPGQFTAQLIGMLAIAVASFALCWLVLRILGAAGQAWQHSGLEFGSPPPPLPFDAELLPAAAEVPDGDGLRQPTAAAQAAPEPGRSES